MPVPRGTQEEEDRQLAEMIESVDLYHGEMRRWRLRRVLRWSVIGAGAVLLLSALSWATGAVAAAALGGFVGFASTGGPSGVERALINLQQAGRAATYAALFSLAGILLLTELLNRLQAGSVPEPPDALRLSVEGDDEEDGDAHEQWMPASDD